MNPNFTAIIISAVSIFITYVINLFFVSNSITLPTLVQCLIVATIDLILSKIILKGILRRTLPEAFLVNAAVYYVILLLNSNITMWISDLTGKLLSSNNVTTVINDFLSALLASVSGSILFAGITCVINTAF